MACTTATQVTNISKKFKSGGQLVGFDDLREADKQKVSEMFGWSYTAPVGRPPAPEAIEEPVEVQTEMGGWGEVAPAWEETTHILVSQTPDAVSEKEFVAEPEAKLEREGSDGPVESVTASTAYFDPPDVVALQLEVYQAQLDVAAAELQVAQAKLKLEQAKARALEYRLAALRMESASN